MWIKRTISTDLIHSVSTRPATLLTGPRQVGKTSLLKKLFPSFHYISLDGPISARAAIEDPYRFLDSLKEPVIIDEVQYAPELFRALKIKIDADRLNYGRYILTGSQKFALMKGLSESLAGRIGILSLDSLGLYELNDLNREQLAPKDLMIRGGFPELWVTPSIGSVDFYESYLNTFLERDLRLLNQVQNLQEYNRFLRLLATRVGQLLNYTDLAKDVGITQSTAKAWVDTLDASGLIDLLPPYFENFGKRLIKAPKVYFRDPGLLAYLLNIKSWSDYENHMIQGSIWENFVYNELIKTFRLKPLQDIYFYRDQNGVEIDFVIRTGRKILLAEAKTTPQLTYTKLNFKKVAPLFKEPTECLQICQILESSPVHLEKMTLLSPLSSEGNFKETLDQWLRNPS